MIYIHILDITSLLCFSELLEQLMAKPVSTAVHGLVIFLFLKVEYTLIYQCLSNIETDLHRKQYLSDFLFFINNPHWKL